MGSRLPYRPTWAGRRLQGNILPIVGVMQHLCHCAGLPTSVMDRNTVQAMIPTHQSLASITTYSLVLSPNLTTSLGLNSR